MRRSLQAIVNRMITSGKTIIYGRGGEPIEYGPHKMRFVPGTRPPRMKYADKGDPGTRNDLRQIDFVLKNVRNGDFALDIGAHAGQYAVLFGTLAGKSGRVISFEPDPIPRATLSRNIALNSLEGTVQVETVALSDSNGSHEFFSLGGNAMSSLARTGLGTAANSTHIATYSVETVRLDDFLERRGLPCPQWIKIDTEGAEILILKGARETMKCARAILCEIHPYAWPGFGSSFDELLEIVKASGRSIRYLDPVLRVSDGPTYATLLIE